MKAYITSTGIISPQETHNGVDFPDSVREEVSDRLLCIEPDYKVLINPVQLRRMPRILKMGLACSPVMYKPERWNKSGWDYCRYGTGMP